MKKIFLLVVLVLFIPLCVKAETFYAGEQVKEVPLYLDKITKQSYRYFKTAYRTSDDVLVYCVEPSKLLSTKNKYNYVTEKQWEKLNVSEDVWRRLELLAYFGYGYESHTSEKWAAITQYMIWQTVLPDGWFLTFTDGYGGEFKNIHENETTEIENLIKDFETKPSFANESFKITKGDKLVLKDNNGVLGNYNLVTASNLSVKASNNELIINGAINGSYILEFVRGVYNPTKLYLSDSDQAVISTDGVPENKFTITVEVSSGNLTLQRGYDDYLDNESKRENAVYEIIDSESNKYILTTDENGEIRLTDLPLGEVSIRELNPSIGYEKDDNTYKTIIKNNEEVILEIEPKLIVKKINLVKKYLITEENLLPNEVGSVFSVIKNNGYKLTDKTDEDGIVSFLIPYGLYTIKQDSTIVDYELMKDYNIFIENSDEETLTFINYKKEAEEESKDKEIPEEIPEQLPESKPELELPEEIIPEEEILPDIKENVESEEIKESEKETIIVSEDEIKIPENVIVENPKTGDNIFKNLNLLIISSLFLVKILRKMQ